MKLSAVAVILRKELGETLRDWRTIVLMVLLPVVLYPSLILVFTQVAGTQRAQLEAQTSQVGLFGEPLPADLLKRFAFGDELDVETVASEAELRAGLEAGRLDAGLVLEEGFVPAVAGGETGRLRLLYDGASERSTQARRRLERRLIELSDQLLAERLVALSLTEDFVRPLETEAANVAPPARMGGHVLGQVLPMLLILTVLLGAFHPAVDLTAGEKERGTLQTLLTAPVTSLEIVTGKYLAVCSIALLAGAVNVGSMALVLAHALSLGGGAAELAVSLSGGDVALLFLAVVVMGLFFSALMMSVAVLARGFKEAQNYLMPVYILCLVPAMLTQIPGFELGHATALAPALNLALLIKGILQAEVGFEAVFLVLLSSLIYTAAVLAVSARLFQRESVLLGTAAPLRALFPRSSAERRRRRAPSWHEAFLLFAVLFVLLYYGGSLLQAWQLLPGLILTLWGLLLLPTLLFVRLGGYSLRSVFALRSPRPRALLSAVLLGVGAWALVSVAVELFQSRFLPLPKELAESMSELLEAPRGGMGEALLFFAVSLSPAICEEVVFRGFLLSAFRRTAPAWLAVALSALLFGLFHLSIYRLLGTFALGVVAGILVVRSGSILPAMVFHALNNATLLLVARVGLVDPATGCPPGWLLVVTSALVLAGGALLAWPFRGAGSGQREAHDGASCGKSELDHPHDGVVG